jgi:hypothetical protein
VFVGRVVGKIDLYPTESEQLRAPGLIVSAVPPVGDGPTLTTRVHSALDRFKRAGVRKIWMYQAIDDPREAVILHEIDNEANARGGWNGRRSRGMDVVCRRSKLSPVVRRNLGPPDAHLPMFVCLCNAVTRQTVEEAVANGASTTKGIAHICGAGSTVGAAGTPSAPSSPPLQRSMRPRLRNEARCYSPFGSTTSLPKAVPSTILWAASRTAVNG